MAGQINYGINFNINSAQLKQLKAELQSIQSLTVVDIATNNPGMKLENVQKQLVQMQHDARALENVFDKAFNTSLGTLNLKKLNKELSNSNLKLNEIGQRFSSIGGKGISAFQTMSKAISSSNLQLKQSSKFLDDMAKTMANTAKWGVASSVLNNMSSSIQKAWSFTKDLDKSLNDIRIVTSKSADEMERFAIVANKAAAGLGKSTKDFTDASLIYYQQGLNDEESQKRAEITLKTANVTGQNTSDVSEQLTAVWNGYKVAIEDSEKYIDKLAAVAADTAADLEELSTGMSKVASAANIMGVDVDQLSATLATVISVTRQAPESVGTAFKTIYARMGDIKAGLDTETSLDKYTQDMLDIGGVNVLDANKELRSMGEVIEEVGNKWSTLSREQQVALSQTMAGTRQYNNLLALFDNWDMYEKAVKTSEGSLGELNRQQEIYMESTEAHLEQLSAAWERVFNSMADKDGINGIIDVMTGLTNGLANFTESLGGGGKALLAFGSIATKVFNKQLASGINQMISNSKVDKQNENKIQQEIDALKLLEQSNPDLALKSGTSMKITLLEELKKEIQNFDVAKIEEIRTKIQALGDTVANSFKTGDRYDKAKNFFAEMFSNEGVYGKLGKDTIDYFVNNGGKIREEDAKDGTLTSAQNKVRGHYDNERNFFTKINQDDKAINAAEAGTRKYIRALEEYLESAKEVRDAEVFPQSLLGKAGALEEQITALEAAIKEIPDDGELTAKALSKLTANADNLRGTIANLSKEYDDMYDAMDEMGEAGGYQEAKDKNWKPIDDEMENFSNEEGTGIFDEARNQRVTEQLIGLASGVGNVASACLTLVNIGNIFTDENLSTGEKTLQIVMALSTAIPMLTTGIKDTRDGLKALGGEIGKVVAARQAQLTAAKVAKVEEAALAAGETAAAAGATAAAAGTASWGAALWSLIWPVGLAIAAIAALVAIIHTVVESYNADAIAAKRAQEATQELTDSHADLQQSLQDLEDSFDAYKTAKEHLDECVEGTEEWNAALEETNDAAIKLINSFKGLTTDQIDMLYARDSKGNIKVNENEVNKLIEQRRAAINATEFAVSGSEKSAVDARVVADAIEVGRTVAMVHPELYNRSSSSDIAVAIEEIAQQFQDILLQNLEQFEDVATLEEFKEKMKDLGMSVDGLSDEQLAHLKDTVTEMANTSEAASKKLQLIAELTVSELVPEEDAETKKIVANQLATREQELQDEWLAKITGDGINRASGHKNEKYQEVLKELNKAGFNYDAQKDNAIRGNDKNRSFAFLDENGEEVIRTAEWVAETIAASKAMSELTGNTEKANAALASLEKNASSKEIAEGVTNWINHGNFENLSENEFAQLQTDINNNGGVTEYLKKTLGVDEATLKQMFGDDYEKKFTQAQNDYSKALNSITDNLVKSARESYEKVNDTESLSVNGKRVIATAIEDALVYGGSQARDTVQQVFSLLDASNIEGFTDVVGQIEDWGKVDIDDLKEQLKAAGVQTNLTDHQLAKFVEVMKVAKQATGDAVASMMEKYQKLHEFMDDLEQGQTISEESYGLLSKTAQTYFTKMLDGTYKLTSDASDFYDIVHKEQIAGFQEKKNSLSKEVFQYQKISDYDFNALKEQQGSGLGNFFSNVISQITGNQIQLNQQNEANVQKQLDILELLSDDQKQVTQWQEALDAHELKASELRDIAEAVGEVEGKFNNLNQTVDGIKAQFYELDLAIASSYKTIDDLQKALAKGEVGEQAYTKAMLEMLEAERMEDLDVKEVEKYADYIQEIAKSTKDFDDSLGDLSDEEAEETAEDLAIQIMRMTTGIDDLADNWENWSDILKKSSKSSEEYYTAMSNVKEAMSDVLDISKEFISSDFVTGHMTDIGKAATGDAEAIDRLRAAALEDIILNMNLSGTSLNADQLAQQVQGLQNMLDGMGDLEVGAKIDDSEFIDACNAMILAADMSADEVNALFSGMGYDVTYEEQPQKISTVIPEYTTYHQPGGIGFQTLTNPDGTTRQALVWKETSWTEQTGSHTLEGETAAFAMQTSQPGTTVTPKIKSVKKKATGSYNNYSKKNAGGPPPGGSSKKGSTKDPDKMDKITEEADRYHQVDTQLAKIDNKLEKIRSQESKFIGAELIANVNEQLEQLDYRIDNLRLKAQIANQEMEELRASLASQGVTFNADGTIANYMQMYEAKVAYVNSLIDRYNSLSADEQEKYKETVEKAKEDLEKFTEDMDRYDELISDFIPGLQNEIQDAIDEEIELNIKKFNMEFEIRLDLKDAQKDWNEFKKKILDDVDEDDIYGNARARAVDDFSNIIGKNGVQNSTKQTEDILAELHEMDTTGWSNVYGDNRAKALEDLRAAYQEIQEDLLELDQIQEDVHQAWLDTMDEINDKMADQVAMYEQITDLIEHDMKVIELVYGETDYDALGNYYEKQHDNYLGLLDFQKQNVDFWEKEMNSIVDKNSEEWKKARDNWIAATNDLNATIEASIESARAKMENAIDGVFKKFNDEITGGMGLDYMQQQWDLINDNADDYLDTINAAFGIRQLENKYQDAIDSTDNVSAQRKLNKLMEEELKALKEKDKLSQYDIDRANMKYDIALKQIALEEAQQTKNTMRLRRDSQGNYRYEYVADDDNIQQLKDELDALENSLYNFDKDRWIEMQNQVVDAVRERQEAIKEIMMDASLSEEERIARLEEINQLYNEKIQNITDLTTDAQINMYDSAAVEIEKIWRKAIEDELEARGMSIDQLYQLYEDGTLREISIREFGSDAVYEAWKKAMNLEALSTEQATNAIIGWFNSQKSEFQKLSDEEKRIMEEEMFPQFDSGVNKMIQSFTGPGGFEAKTVAAMEHLSRVTLEYKADLEAIQRAAGTSFSDIQKGIDPAITKTQQLVRDNDSLNREFTEQIELIKQLNQQLQAQIDKYSQISAAAKKAAQDAHNYWVQQQEQAAAEAAAEKEKQKNSTEHASNNIENNTNNNGGDSSHGGTSDRVLNEDAMAGIAGAIWVYGSDKSGWGTGSTRYARISEKFGADYASKVQSYINKNAGNASVWRSLDWGDLKNYYYNKFDTGGYTGDWAGDYGKIAMLHSKEIVLNKDDTKNLLSMVDIARSVMANAGPRAKALAAGYISNSNSQLEQNVHIEANFPNVETASEIEEALNNLVQMASQRASRNLRG